MGYYDKQGDRLTNYVEDSTKGSSMIRPVNYKGDVLMNVRTDSRVLATVSDWLERNGQPARNMSEIVNRAMQMLCEHIVETKQVEMIDDTNVARILLQTKYRVNLNRGGRGLKNLLHNQVLSSLRPRLADVEQPMKEVKRPSQEELDRVVEMFNKISGESLESMKRDAIESARNSNLLKKEE